MKNTINIWRKWTELETNFLIENYYDKDKKF